MAFGDLTTLADVRAWLQTGQSPFPITDDALLVRLLSAASQYIQTWISAPLALQDWIETRDGPASSPFAIESKFVFGAFPVSAVLSVDVAGTAIPSATSAYAAGYIFSPTMLTIRGWRIPRLTQCVTITYTAGHSTIPPEIAQACVELVALRYRERTRIGEVSKSLGGAETVSYSQKDMTDGIKTILQQYRAVAPVSSFLRPAPTQTDTATLVAAA